MIYFVGFIFCAVTIFIGGRKLAYYGDMIALVTKMDSAWIALIVIAAITSLPELMVGLSSSAIVGSADLAVGDIFGSCSFNLGLLALLDAFVPKRKPLFGLASEKHTVAAAMNIILIALAGVGLLLPSDLVIVQEIGLTSVVFISIYFFSIWLLYRLDLKSKQQVNDIIKEKQKSLSRVKIFTQFSIYGGVIIGASLLLPYFTDHIASIAGLNRTLAGTLLLAISTSLPEIAVSIAALRSGSIDIAVGNLLGSNLFNIFTLAIDDIFYTKGYLLKDASHLHLISCLATIIMAAIAIIGLNFRLQVKRYWLAWDALLIFGTYVINIVLLYYLST